MAGLHSADENYPASALIMRGGGAKGLAYVGALLELEKFYRFNVFVGTSAGALTAALLGAGIKSEDLQKRLIDTDFSKFMDGGKLAIFNLLTGKGGLHPGDALRRWVSDAVQEELGSPNPVPLNKLPRRVVMYAVSRDGTETFDSTGQNDDAYVDFAARCSAGIPYVFTRKEHNGRYLYDGGLLSNFPVARFVEQNPGYPFIALFLGSARALPGSEAGSVIADLLGAVLGQGERTDIERYRDRTVVIDPSPITTLQFSLCREEKEYLVLQGRAAALEFLVRQEHYADDNEHVVDIRRKAKQARDTLFVRERAVRRRRLQSGVLLAVLLGLVVTAQLLARRTASSGQSATAASGSVANIPAEASPDAVIEGAAEAPQESAGVQLAARRVEVSAAPREMIRILGAHVQIGVDSPERFREWCTAQEFEPADCDAFIGRLRSRSVTVATFDIDRVEVTAGEFAKWLNQVLDEGKARVVGARVFRVGDNAVLSDPKCLHRNALRLSRGRAGVTNPVEGRQAVVCVSFAAAAWFCESGKKRLPREEEWELAAGGVSKRFLSWGAPNDYRPSCKDAVFGGNTGGPCMKLHVAPAVVDAIGKDVTPEGVLGLSGNVSEWVEGFGADAVPVVKGGSWAGLALDLHPAKVMVLDRLAANAATVGFRCAQTPNKGEQSELNSRRR